MERMIHERLMRVGQLYMTASPMIRRNLSANIAGTTHIPRYMCCHRSSPSGKMAHGAALGS